MAGEVLRVGRKLTFGTDRSWRKADIRETPTSAKYQQPDIPENRLLTPELYSRPGRLSFGRLTGATSRRSICVHRQGELKRGPLGCVCRGPQPATVGFHNRTADRESHAHAAGFGGEEGVEQPVRVLGGNSDAADRPLFAHPGPLLSC